MAKSSTQKAVGFNFYNFYNFYNFPHEKVQ